MRKAIRMRDGHSSWTPVARRLQQPTRTADPDTDLSIGPARARQKLMPSLFGLAPGGVCPAASVAAGAVRSYRTFSPLPRSTQRAAAVCSLWHFPWARARRTLSGTACPWSPDCPPRQPFGFAGAAVRPTDRHRDGDVARRRQEGRSQSLGCEPREVAGTGGNRPHPAALRGQVAQCDPRRMIADTVDPFGSEMALECFHDVVGR